MAELERETIKQRQREGIDLALAEGRAYGSETMAMADRIIVMRNGEIEQVDTPAEIYYHLVTEFVATFDGQDLTIYAEMQQRFVPGDEVVVLKE